MEQFSALRVYSAIFKLNKYLKESEGLYLAETSKKTQSKNYFAPRLFIVSVMMVITVGRKKNVQSYSFLPFTLHPVVVNPITEVFVFPRLVK